MPDMYGFLHESCTGRFKDWAVSTYVWGSISISFRGNCSANEDDQDWYWRWGAYPWWWDRSFQTWEDLCKQDKICSRALHMHGWRYCRCKTGWDPEGWLWPYRWENVRRDRLRKLRCRSNSWQICSTCTESSSSWTYPDPWMFWSGDRKSSPWGL